MDTIVALSYYAPIASDLFSDNSILSYVMERKIIVNVEALQQSDLPQET